MWEGWTRVSSVLTPVSVTLSWMWGPTRDPAVPYLLRSSVRLLADLRGSFRWCWPRLRQLLKCSLYPPLPEGPQVTQPSCWDEEFSQASNLPTTRSGNFIFRPAAAFISNPDFGIFWTPEPDPAVNAPKQQRRRSF